MCIIVDANQAHIVLGQPHSERARPIWAWLRRDGVIIYGGKLFEELSADLSARGVLAELLRAGKAHIETKAEVLREENALREEGQMISDDPHVIALARTSGARVLMTEDRALMADFANLLRPRGRIYRRASHDHLLTHRRGCRRPPPRR